MNHLDGSSVFVCNRCAQDFMAAHNLVQNAGHDWQFEMAAELNGT